MDYVVNQTKQIAVTAENPEEAIQKGLNGEGQIIAMNLSANPRPQAPQIARATMPVTAQTK